MPDAVKANRPLAGRMTPGWSRGLLRGPVKAALRRAICESVDWFDALTGRADPLTPLARLRVRVGCFLSFIRIERYREVGREFSRHLQTIAKLQPGDALLDLGCGCGQVASALCGFLTGRYEGIDPDQEAIKWCRTHISTRYRQFQFQDVNLFNGYYNPAGTVDPRTWQIPYASQSFDVVLLKSVFTHMLRPDLENYLSQIARVLRPGGRCLASLYLLNDEATSLCGEGRCDFSLSAAIDGGAAFSAETPEYIVGWREQTIHQAAAAAGLRIRPPVDFGSWCGRADAVSYQDLVVFEHDAG